MRIVRWEEFKQLPEGTIFQDWKPHYLGDLMILGDVLEYDFVAADLLPSCGEGDYFEPEHPLKNAGMIIAMPSHFGRDGLFDLDERRWLIWDKEDRERLAQWLLDPKTAVEAQNTDDALYVIPVDAE